MTSINIHNVKTVVITENRQGVRSQSRDIVFLDNFGKEILSMNIFSGSEKDGSEIKLVDDESFINWQFEQQSE